MKMLDNLQKVIAGKLVKFARSSAGEIVLVFPELLFDAISYGVDEGHTLNCKRPDGSYLHQARFMGFKFQTVSEHRVYDSDDFFRERPAR